MSDLYAYRTMCGACTHIYDNRNIYRLLLYGPLGKMKRTCLKGETSIINLLMLLDGWVVIYFVKY